jgi:hypothetical protein
LKYFSTSVSDSVENGKEELILFIKYNYPGALVKDNGDCISYELSDTTTENMVLFLF